MIERMKQGAMLIVLIAVTTLISITMLAWIIEGPRRLWKRQ